MAACRLNNTYHYDTHGSLHLILIQIKSKAQGKAGSAIPLYFALIRVHAGYFCRASGLESFVSPLLQKTLKLNVLTSLYTKSVV